MKFQDLLHKNLSYQIQGAAIEVRKDFGPGHKESIYQNAFAEELKFREINFDKEKSIKIHSPKSGKIIGSYRPDFIIDNKIIVELKALEIIPRKLVDQLYDYLRNSNFELGYFINFCAPKLYMKRIIFTNDRKPWLKKLVVLSLLLVAFSVLPAQAATLYLDPPEIHAPRGETFVVEIRIDPEGECINTVQADLTFSNNILQAIDFNDANSILSLWVVPPKIDQIAGSISFIGGVPGGYCGQVSGDPGKSNLLGKLIFRAPKEIISSNSAQINFKDGSKVLLHDGLGTEAKVTLRNANVIITETPFIEELKPKEDQWYKELKEDKTPPEPFKIEIAQDPQIFEGKYFITFLTADKQTGIDYYEVRESPQRLTLRGAKWIKAGGPPYLLQDQTLSSIIEVQAIDKAGNERLTKIKPEYKKTWKDWLFGVILILVAIMGFLIAKFRSLPYSARRH